MRAVLVDVGVWGDVRVRVVGLEFASAYFVGSSFRSKEVTASLTFSITPASPGVLLGLIASDITRDRAFSSSPGSSLFIKYSFTETPLSHICEVGLVAVFLPHGGADAGGEGGGVVTVGADEVRVSLEQIWDGILAGGVRVAPRDSEVG